MTEKNLMIGDLVRYGTYLAEIISLEGDGKAYILCRKSQTKKEKILVEIKDLKPLHLTDNILEANNFKWQEGWNEYWHYKPNDIASDIQLEKKEHGYALSGRIDIEIDYVHELQNASRMLKLFDLADNIKTI